MLGSVQEVYNQPGWRWGVNRVGFSTLRRMSANT